MRVVRSRSPELPSRSLLLAEPKTPHGRGGLSPDQPISPRSREADAYNVIT